MTTELSFPGPSSLGRVWRCITSEALPHFENAPHEYARLGETMHTFLRIASEEGREAALAWAYKNHRGLLEAFELVPFERLPPIGSGNYSPEVSIALEVKTGKARVIGQGLNRNEARALARPGEMIGTLDLVALEDDGVLVVDWKSGWKQVEPAQINWQLKTYMLMAARAAGVKRARCAIIRVLWNGSVPPWDWAEMDEWDIQAHEAELRQLMRRRSEVLELAANGGPLPSVVLGSHCDYCPALRSCPAHLALVRSIANVDEVKALSPEDLGRGYIELERRKKALHLVEAWFRATAKQSPIQLENGEVLGVKLQRTETISPDRAKDALVELFGDGMAEAIIGECVTTTSKFTKKALRKALKDLVQPHRPESKISHLERETLEKLRERRALTAKESKPVKKYRLGKGDEEPEDTEEGEVEE